MKNNFNFSKCEIPGLFTIERQFAEDNRGFFTRSYCSQEFIEVGLNKPIMQMNNSLTKTKGSIRGLHFQFPPFAEAKIIYCVQGEVFDVAVDIRQGSATFLQWNAEVISAENKKGLYIPEGFAHGFQSLTDNCELLYLHNAPYNAAAEGALNITDPKINIQWPEAMTECSPRDRKHPLLTVSFTGIKTL